MITSVIALCFLLLLTAGLAGKTGWTAEESLPAAVCLTVCWLYPFYCLSAIWIGLALLCALAVFLFARSLKIQGHLKSCLTPGILAYLIMCAMFLVFFSGNYVSRWDELRLWGAVPKAMHELGTLQLGKASPIFSEMQSYPPGLSLLTFFFSAFAGDFCEGALYVGYACCTMAFFMPAFSGWQWKNWKQLAPWALLVYAVPFVFTSHWGDSALFGMSLFVDNILGVLAGYAFYLASRKPFRSGAELLSFSLALMTLSLLKSTGIVFGVCALICALVLEGKRPSLTALIPAGGLLAGFGTWKLLLGWFAVSDSVPLRMHLLDGEELSNLLHALVSINVVLYKIPLGPLLSFLVVYAVLWLCLWLRRKERRTHGTVAVLMLLSTLVFLYGYAAIYARTLESFPRYMTTPLMCAAVYLTIREIPMLSGGKIGKWIRERKPWLLKGAVCACLVMALGVTAVWKLIFPVFEEQEQANADAARIRQMVLSDDPQKPVRIYLLMAGDGVENSRYHHRVFLELMSPEMNLGNKLFETRVVAPDLTDPASSWSQELEDDLDYVYVHSVEDALIPVFRDISGQTPRAETLYRVVVTDTDYGVTLIPVE